MFFPLLFAERTKSLNVQFKNLPLYDVLGRTDESMKLVTLFLSLSNEAKH